MTQIPALELFAPAAPKSKGVSASAKPQVDFSARMQEADRDRQAAPTAKSEGPAASQAKAAQDRSQAAKRSNQEEVNASRNSQSEASAKPKADAPKASEPSGQDASSPAQETPVSHAPQPTATDDASAPQVNGPNAEPLPEAAAPSDEAAGTPAPLPLPVEAAAQAAAEAANAALVAALTVQAPVVQSPQATALANAAAASAAATAEAAPSIVPTSETSQVETKGNAMPVATASPETLSSAAAKATVQAVHTPVAPAPAVVAPVAPVAPVAQATLPVPVVGMQVSNETSGQTPVQTSLEWLLTNFTPADTPKDASGSTTLTTTLDDASSIGTMSLSALSGDDGEAASQQNGDLSGQTNASGALVAAGTDGMAGKSIEGAKFHAAQAAAAAPRPEDVLPQILKQTELLKATQANSVKLQLYPEHLGKMEIKVSVRDGLVSAQLFAHSHEVKGLLESQVASLQRSFAELGLKVDKVEVALASSNLGNDFGGAGQMTQDPGHGHQQDAQAGLDRHLAYEPWMDADALSADADEARDAYALDAGSTAINAIA